MEWAPWSRADEKGLARYVTPAAVQKVRLPDGVDRLRLARKELVKVIYNQLQAKKIKYAPEKYNPNEAIQEIRTPSEVLEKPGEGTCLDLAALFCGICLGYDLLPLLIVIKRHAFAMVSLTHGNREFHHHARKERGLFNQGLLINNEAKSAEVNSHALCELIDSGQYVAVECTGFAWSESLDSSCPEGKEREDGVLLFKRSLDAGREQFDVPDRPFEFALDITALQAQWEFTPFAFKDSLAPPKRCDFYEHTQFQYPTNYIERPGLLAVVRRQLLADVETTAVVQCYALHGMGGIGKTALARALCDDEEVRTMFKDGILAATLGHEATDNDIRGWLRDWIAALGGIVTETAPSLPRLNQILAESLHDRACLLIVDDVWDRSLVQHFRAGGSHCRLLITTRDAEIARDLDAHILEVPVLDEKEAVTLLQKWSNEALASVRDAVKKTIVKRLGYLALAIRLAGVQLRSGMPDIWLAKFDVRELKTRRNNDIHDSLEKTFGLSLDDLNSNKRRLYASLIIFREDEAVAEPAIAQLWKGLADLSDYQTHELLYDLDARALLDLNPSDCAPALQRTEPIWRVTIHDLLREFLRGELSAAETLAAQCTLLAAYRATQTGAGWHTAPDDGYLYDHLAYHLDQVVDRDEAAAVELQTLFASYDWLHKRVTRSKHEYDGYIADLMFGWRHVYSQVRQQIETEQPLTAFASCARYVLIHTSITSIATSYIPELVARAVETGLWSQNRAAGVANKMIDPVQRVRTISAILQTGKLDNTIKVGWQRLGLDYALAITDNQARAQALTSLAPQLDDVQCSQALHIALDAAVAIHDDQNEKATTLTQLTSQLQGTAKNRALQEALNAVTQSHQNQIQLMIALLPQLTGARKKHAIQQTRQYIQARDSSSWYPIAAGWFAQIEARLALAKHLNKNARHEILSQALEVAGKIGSDYGEPKYKYFQELNELQCILLLIRQVSGDLFQNVIDLADSIAISEARIIVLVGLARQAKGKKKDKILEQVLEAVPTIRHELLAEILTFLIPQLTAEQKHKVVEQTLKAVSIIERSSSRVEVLTLLIPHLTGEQKSWALKQAVEALPYLDPLESGVWYQSGYLKKLIPYLVVTSFFHRSLGLVKLSVSSYPAALVPPFSRRADDALCSLPSALVERYRHPLASDRLCAEDPSHPSMG